MVYIYYFKNIKRKSKIKNSKKYSYNSHSYLENFEKKLEIGNLKIEIKK